jgi:hypothetical protein
MYNQERNIFIEKFRKDQGLDSLSKTMNANSINQVNMNNSVISNKTNKLNHSAYLNSNSNKKTNFKSNMSVKQNKVINSNSKNNINKIKYTDDSQIMNNNVNNSRTNYIPRRWDYLHQLEKVKQAKIAFKRQKMNNENDSKFQEECTFNPIFYTKNAQSRSKSKGKLNVRNNSSNRLFKNNISSSIENNQNNTHNSSNIMNMNNSLTNNNIVRYNNNNNQSENDLLNCDVNQRTEMWIRKKANKTESMKQQLIDREVEECYFKPQLVSKIINL